METASERLRIEFVCWANICRSPFAEAYARAQADPTKVEFTSSGLQAQPGRPMDDLMAAELALIGVGRPHPSERTGSDAIAQADLVLTMEARQRRQILDEWPSAVRKVYTLGQFAEIAGSLPAAPTRRERLRAAHARRGRPSRSLDVDDPYGRGEQAAEVAAHRIMEMVDHVLLGLDLMPAPTRAVLD